MTLTIVHHGRSQRGFSMLDMMATLSVLAVVGSMATMQVGTVRHSLKGDGALRLAMTTLNTAREMAISQRRYMEVKFVGTNWMQIIRNDVPTGTSVLTNVAFEGNAQYSLIPGVPDTPDAFGNGAAINFGSGRIMFRPDGALIDDAGNPVNGTVFFSVLDSAESFRAVTVAGLTGRVRGFRWNGAAWSRV
jgi:Tfp pilus assembly protein FimT